jgi:hypothetical protein
LQDLTHLFVVVIAFDEQTPRWPSSFGQSPIACQQYSPLALGAMQELFIGNGRLIYHVDPHDT